MRAAAALRHFLERILGADRIDFLRLGIFFDRLYAIADLGRQSVLDMGRGDRIGFVRLRCGRFGSAGLAMAFLAVTIFFSVLRVPATALDALGGHILIIMVSGVFLFLAQQRLAVGNRYLIVVWMDFRKSQETVTVAAVIDERRLERRLNARHLGEIDVAFQLFACGAFEIEFFDASAANHHHTGFFRMGGVDEHFAAHMSLSFASAEGWTASVSVPGRRRCEGPGAGSRVRGMIGAKRNRARPGAAALGGQSGKIVSVRRFMPVVIHMSRPCRNGSTHLPRHLGATPKGQWVRPIAGPY